jgi:hypothetical protein
MPAEPLVLCPVCRVPIADKDYFAHAQAHQRKAAAEAKK